MAPEQLTPREIEVLKLIASGDSGKEIAAKLGIAFRTARSHRSNLMEKLDAHDTAALVRYAIRIGLIQA
jgi:DNA-binding NarL/FixJ family response regulator